MWDRVRQIKDAWSWAKFAWQVAVFLGLSGVVVSVGGTVWAMILQVPTPIALMAGYCTFVGAVYMALAPLAYRALIARQPETKAAAQRLPNYAAVRLMHEFRLGPASRLWCDIDQNAPATPESRAWQEAFEAAIKRGDLPFIPKDQRRHDMMEYEKQNPDFNTVVKRESLKKFAASHGAIPKFLRDT